MLRGTFFYDPGFPVRPWGLMLVIGFLAAIIICSRLFKRRGLAADHAINITFWVFLLSIIGARMFFVLPRIGDPAHNLSSPLSWLAVWDGGMVFYGGLLGGIIAALIYAKWQKLQVRDILDIAAVGLVIGYAFGRLGCFFNGCCYGTPTDLPWGVVYPPTAQIWMETGLPLGTPVHPVQLYDALIYFLFTPVMIWIFNKGKKGVTVLSYIGFYAVTRFLLELIRGDNPHMLGFLTRPQLVTIGVFFIFLVHLLAVYVGNKRKVNPDQVYFWGVALTPIGGLVYSLVAPQWTPPPLPAPTPTPEPTEKKKVSKKK